jgi:hypothetical protein
MLTHAERILFAAKTIENLLRARKAVRLYPDRNRVTENAVDDFYQELLKLLSCQDRVAFEIRQDSILFEMEDVFRSLSRESSLPHLLFHDGIREISFRKGLTRDEALRFVIVLSCDLGQESGVDDMITRIWEQDFMCIRCIVYDPLIFDRTNVKEALKSKNLDYADLSTELKRIYNDAAGMDDDTFLIPDILELTDDELMALRSDTDTNLIDRTGKALAISLELFLLSSSREYELLESNMKRAVEYALSNKKMDVLADFFMKVRVAYMDSSADSELRHSLLNIFSFFSSERFLVRVGAMLDEGMRLDRDTFEKLSKLLDGRSVSVLVKLLGYLDTISARKTVLNLLAAIGSKNMSTLYGALSDERWYVVRNIVIALRRIGDQKARKYLLAMLDHRDNRVRREAIKALAELGGNEAIDLLKRALDDPDMSVRQFAFGSLGNLDAEVTKKLLMEKVRGRRFRDLSYSEKREYYSALLRYDGDDVVHLLSGMLMKRSFFKRATDDDNRAAIAYCIGAQGCRSFLPALRSIDKTGSELLRNNVDEAIRKIGNER